MVQNNPFVSNGPIPPDSQVYVEREADRRLLEYCLNGEFVHIQAPQFLGKTSLLLRTADRLRTENVASAVIDLSRLDASLGVEQWYRQLVQTIGQGLFPRNDVAWLWHEQTNVREFRSLWERLINYLEVLSKDLSTSAVIFLDNSEQFFRVDPSADFFSTAERYVKLPRRPRISFVTSSNLARAPDGFQTIELADFNYSEVTPLIYALDVSYEVMSWVMNWTDGHPYLTQTLCSRMFEEKWRRWTADDIAEVVSVNFLGNNLIDPEEYEPHLAYIQGAMTETQMGVAALEKYRLFIGGEERGAMADRQIEEMFSRVRALTGDVKATKKGKQAIAALQLLREGKVPSASELAALEEYKQLIQEEGPGFLFDDLAYLLEIGLLKHKGRGPQVRNRIYAEVFNKNWVEAQLADLNTIRFDGRDLSLKPGGFIVANRYRLERRIGKGTAGDVYVANEESAHSNETVAIRLIPFASLDNELSYQGVMSRLDDWVKDVNTVSHQNVVNILDHGFGIEGYFYVIMEYVEAGNLSWLLASTGALTTNVALSILSQITEALHAGHRKNIFHGHLTPQNIFVARSSDDQPLVKVADFGIGQLMNRGPYATTNQPPRSGEVGDPLYLAPEQLLGQPWDQRADIYALGMVAYRMLGGRIPPFENLANTLIIKQAERFVSLRELRSDISEETEQVVTRALAYDAERRLASAREWFRELADSFNARSRVAIHAPEGATIYIDGVEQGNVGPTERRDFDLAVGVHELLAVKADEESRHEIQVEPGIALYVNTSLSHKPSQPPTTPASPRYWFYLSCAEEDLNDDRVRRFYNDLKSEVRRITGDKEERIGWFNGRDFALHENLPALQNSRTLVPLFTPNYFKSVICGKVWQFFLERIQAWETLQLGPDRPPPIILPVLWSPKESLPQPLPVAAESIRQIEWGNEGLRDVQGSSSRYYNSLVSYFVGRLVETARSNVVPPLAAAPATYADLRNAFAEPTSETKFSEAEPPPPPPRQGRWIAVAGTSGQITELLQKVSIEVGEEIARRGYGLVTGSWSGVDESVLQGFSSQIGDENTLQGLVKIVTRQLPTGYSGAEVVFVNQGENEREVALADAVVLIGGRDGTYEFYLIAQRLGKPVFPILGTGGAAERVHVEMSGALAISRLPINLSRLALPLEKNTDVRRVTEDLLDLIDDLWPSSKTTIAQTEALSRLTFLRGDLLDQTVDAIVNSVGRDPRSSGEVGAALLQRLGRDEIPALALQEELNAGETITTFLHGRLNSKYVIHVCSESTRGSHTLESITKAVKGALKRADALGLESIAFPAIGTGGAGFNPGAVAEPFLEAVVEYLSNGSSVERILLVFQAEQQDLPYLEVFERLGGVVSVRVLLPRLADVVGRALLFADSLRISKQNLSISTIDLVWGFYQNQRAEAVRELLTANYTESEIEQAFTEVFANTNTEKLPPGFQLRDNPDVIYFPLARQCEDAFLRARELAGDRMINERHVLAGLVSIKDSAASLWLAKISGVDKHELFDIIAVHGDDVGDSIAAQIRSRQDTQVIIATTAWSLTLSTPQVYGANQFRVGELVTVTLDFQPALNNAEPDTLRIPVNSLELTGYIRAPACQLQLEIPFTIRLNEGRPDVTSFSFDLKPLLSGEHSIEVEVYPGGRVSNLRPTLLSYDISVAPIVGLPNIKELIDRREVPYPQPDVMLYVALEESDNREQVRLYLTCAALQLDRVILDPLDLNQRDIAELRAAIVETAATANGLSAADSLALLRSLGATLFDRLVTGTFFDYFEKICNLAAQRSWSWLIISDEQALLPWDLLCGYADDPPGTIQYDDFLADKFEVAYWVGQRGLRLMNTVPMGGLDLIHYNQRPQEVTGWAIALNDDDVNVESDAAKMLLPKQGSYCYGLHLLRYAQEQQTKEIVELREKPADEMEGEAIVANQKLDLTLKRPTVCLSFVSDLEAATPGATWLDTRLEASWLLPLMQAGASALCGPRWPVSIAGDQTFYQSFYESVHHGETLGVALSRARSKLRAMFPDRSDWLAYCYFGHPHAEPYNVRPASGFTLIEALDQPEGEHFVGGRTYRFRASYRTEAPVWYDGRLQIQAGEVQMHGVSIMVMPLSEIVPSTYPLEPVAQGNELQNTFALTMPDEATTFPVMVRFQHQTQELRTMIMHLPIREDF
jgi:serine/threonine protein kinase/O-acetyl-ADP-ribose deacetylase (regulator of RNase III)